MDHSVVAELRGWYLYSPSAIEPCVVTALTLLTANGFRPPSSHGDSFLFSFPQCDFIWGHSVSQHGGRHAGDVPLISTQVASPPDAQTRCAGHAQPQAPHSWMLHTGRVQRFIPSSLAPTYLNITRDFD